MQKSDGTKWFDDYKHTFKTLNIQKKYNIINFNKARFYIGCIKKHKILMPFDIKHHYAVSSENCKSAIIIEIVNVAGKYLSSLMVIIQD